MEIGGGRRLPLENLPTGHDWPRESKIGENAACGVLKAATPNDLYSPTQVVPLSFSAAKHRSSCCQLSSSTPLQSPIRI